MKQFVIFAVLMACGAAQAQQVDCAKFSAAVEDGQKQLSMSAVSGNAAVSAIALANIQSSLAQMQAAKCKMPENPISAEYYRMSAVICRSRSTSGYATAQDTADACDTRKWERDKR